MISFLVKTKNIIYFTFFVCSIQFCIANVILPLPQNKDGIGIFDALKKRASTQGGRFTTSSVSLNELSTILWAASGINRGKNGLTVPMYLGLKPYVKIYVTSEYGTFLYQPNGHLLLEVSKKDIRRDISIQSFAQRAFYSLIFVADDAELLTKIDKELSRDFVSIAVGAMSQNIYLAATSLKLDVRFIHSIKHQIINEQLNLMNDEKPIGIMLLSK